MIALASLPLQAQKPSLPDVIQQLLALPAPRPANSYQPPPPSLAGYDENHLPPDNAPIEVLEMYWSTGGPHPEKTKMSARVRQRFLDYAEQHRDKLPFFLDQEFLPDTPDTHAYVKAALEAGLTSYYGQLSEAQVKRHEETWKGQLREWLLLHSQFFLDELEQKAKAAKDENGEIAAERYVKALAKLDGERAKPILDNYAYSPHPRTATLALALLYEYAAKSQSSEAETLRTRLQQVVTNQQMPGKARALACEMMMQAKWEGRDEWFLSLFADDSLRAMEDGGSGTVYPLNKPVLAEPEHWIPMVAKLVGHNNPAIHEAAVDCLASFDPDAPRKEALQPLLPWLANPNWAEATGRKELLQSLKKVKLPEAVPGLIWVVENEEDAELCLYAAEALATHRDRRAVPALKRLLTRPLGPSERTTAIEALIACGGLSDDEMAKAIDAYAMRITATSKGDFDDNAPLQIAIGKVLSETGTPREEVAIRLLDRIKTLEKTQPTFAKILLVIVQKWNLRVVDADIVNRIAAGKAEVKELENALRLRDRLKKSVSAELQSVAVRSDLAAGIAAAILADETLYYKILSDKDKEPKRALLAAARLTRTSLPLQQVGALLNDPVLKFAAERYLESEDSGEARNLLLAQHPGEALILGAWEDFGSKPKQANFLQWEERLRAEVLAQGGADEIIALLASKDHQRIMPTITKWQTQNQLVIRVRKGKAELAWYKDEGRYEYRELEAAEWQVLRDLLADKHIEDLPPYIVNPGAQQTEYEFLRLTKQGGRRVYLVNPEKSVVTSDPYTELLRQFRGLTENKEFNAHYDIQSRVKGMEVVLANPKNIVTSVCGDGSKIAVFVTQPVNLEAFDPRTTMTTGTDWYEVTGGKIGAKVEMPTSCGLYGFVTTMSDVTGQTMTIIRSSPSDPGNAVPNYLVIKTPQPGIARFPNFRDAFMAGNYQDVLETPDNKWLLAVKGTGNKHESLVRIDLTTRQEHPVKLAINGIVALIRFLPTHNKFLFCHSVSNGSVEYYLLDLTNGEFEKVTGDFRPLSRHQREFQPTGQPDETWALVYDQKTRARMIGRYNLKTFSFTPVNSIPELSFNSSELWVDETKNAIYVAYRGHLLRFPLAP